MYQCYSLNLNNLESTDFNKNIVSLRSKHLKTYTLYLTLNICDKSINNYQYDDGDVILLTVEIPLDS